MGVYRAIKVVYRKSFDSERPFQRELEGIRRFEPISRSHASFVHVLHVGQNEKAGCFYYIMELGDDAATGQQVRPNSYVPKTLARQIKGRKSLPLAECIRLGLSLSSGLDHLHEHGLVHRDVKPSNIIFVNGVPKLADIGLVAGIDEARSYVGTEGFIPPEGPGSPQADVYSLGKVLYEVSTGKDRHDFPELPTMVRELDDPGLFVEFNEVILRACKNDLAARYRTAQDMHADFVLLSNGKSVRRLRLLEERFARLKRGAGIAAVVATILGVALFQIQREVNFARKERQRKIGTEVANGTHLMEEGDFLGASWSFANALELEENDSARNGTHRTRFRAVLEQAPKLAHVWFGTNSISTISFDPSGRWVLAEEDFGKLRVFGIETGKLLVESPGEHIGQEYADWHPVEPWIATSGADNCVNVWDLNDAHYWRLLIDADTVFSVKFSFDGSRVVTACKDEVVRIWDANTGVMEIELVGHTGPVRYATFSHHGRFVVSTGEDKTARIWEVGATNGVTRRILPDPSWVMHAAFSPDDRKVVTTGYDHTARLWDVDSGDKPLRDLKHEAAVNSAEFSPDGRMILTACADGGVRLWDADTGQMLDASATLWHGSPVLHASFSPNGRLVATAQKNGTASVWDLAGTSMIPETLLGNVSKDASRLFNLADNTFQVLETSSNAIVADLPLDLPPTSSTLSRNGKFLVTMSEIREGTNFIARVFQTWDCAKQEIVGPPIRLESQTASVSISDDGQTLVALDGHQAQLWSTHTGEAVSPTLWHETDIAGVTLSPDHRYLAARGGTSVSLWNKSTGRLVGELLRHEKDVSLAEFSPDSRTVVTASSDGSYEECDAQVWLTGTGHPVGARMRHRDGIKSAAYSPDSLRIVTGSEDRTTIVWDATTGQRLGPPMHLPNEVLAVAFSPDGRWIATGTRGDQDGSARVWDAETFKPLTPLLPHPSFSVWFVGFSADLGTLVTAGKDGRIWLWDIQPDRRPQTDLSLLADFQNGFRSPVSQFYDSHTPEGRTAIWERLRSAYPNEFEASEGEIIDWYLRAARDSQKKLQWAAAIFNLEILAKLCPEHEEYSEQLNQAKEKLAAQRERR